MRQSIDLTGIRFGKLKVVCLSDKSHKDSRGKQVNYWDCTCDCGNSYTVSTGNLRRKNRPTTRCKECVNANSKNKHPMYKNWISMRTRAFNQASYLRKGIKICHEWNDFLAFAKWCENMKIPEVFELDRIDNDGDYEPSNCQFLTPEEHRIKTARDKMSSDYTNSNTGEKYITKIKDGRYQVIVENRQFIGRFSTLEEAIKAKEKRR